MAGRSKPLPAPAGAAASLPPPHSLPLLPSTARRCIYFSTVLTPLLTPSSTPMQRSSSQAAQRRQRQQRWRRAAVRTR